MERCVAGIVIILFSRHSPGFNGFQSIMIDEDVERSTKRKEDEKYSIEKKISILFSPYLFSASFALLNCSLVIWKKIGLILAPTEIASHCLPYALAAWNPFRSTTIPIFRLLGGKRVGIIGRVQ